MKKTNKRFIVLIVLCILAFSVIGIKKAYRYYSQKYVSHRVFPNLNQKTVSDILIKNNGQQYDIYSKNGQWKIKKNGVEYNADPSRIQQILSAFSSFKKNDIVSNNPAKKSDFGIGPESIILQSGTQNYSVFIGKNSGVDTVYVTVDNNPDVFTSDLFTDILSPSDFRDLNPHVIANESNVSKVSIENDTNTLTIQNSKGSWTSGTTPLLKERVDFFLNDIKTLKANDVVPYNTVQDQLATPYLTLVITEHNKTTATKAYEKDKDNYYVHVENAPLIYEIPAVYITSLNKQLSDFTK